MARFFYFYKSGQIILSILCIIFLSAVTELCRTEQANFSKGIVKRNAVDAAHVYYAANESRGNESLIDDLVDSPAAPAEVRLLQSNESTKNDVENGINEVGKTLERLNETLLDGAAAATVEVKSLQSNESTKFLMNVKNGEEAREGLNETLLDVKDNESSLLYPENFIDESPANFSTLDDTQLLIDATMNQHATPSPLFINDSRTVIFTTYCISIPFFNADFFNSLNWKNASTVDGMYPVYAQKLSKRYIPIISLFMFIIYCIIRMLCLTARPYSNTVARHRQACPCSTYFHCCFSLIVLGLGLFSLLYAHHYWNNIYDWPHIYAMVDFPIFWLFAEVIFLLLILTVAIEIGLRDCLYAVIKLDRTHFGYRLPPYHADSTLMSTINASTTPLQPRNFFDDAQYEPNEADMTITELANLHRCYGSRRSGIAAQKSTFNQQQLPSESAVNESSSSNNTYSNCACSTFKHSPVDNV
uniref:Transmembrane protein n=1 Tax=Panagrolaimus superbus TaxID=310955 RepID=A0A914Y3B1_9BILA